MALRVVISLFGVIAASPSVAQACAVCFGGEDDNRQAFIDTTVILTVVPLSLIGLFVWLLMRRIAKVESLRQQQLEADRATQLSTAESAEAG